MNTRILLVDDYEIVRESLRFMLQKVRGFEIVGGAEDGATAFEKAMDVRPDLILMDMELGDMDGIEASAEILAALPGTRIMLLSGVVDSHMINLGIETGISGFLSKTNLTGELIPAVRAVMNGELYLCQDASKRIVTPDQKSLARTSARNLFRLTTEPLRMNEITSLLQIGINSVHHAMAAPSKVPTSVTANRIINQLHEVEPSPSLIFAQ